MHMDLKVSFGCQIMTYQLSLAETKWMCVRKHVGVFLREAIDTNKTTECINVQNHS